MPLNTDIFRGTDEVILCPNLHYGGLSLLETQVKTLFKLNCVIRNSGKLDPEYYFYITRQIAFGI